MRGARIGVRGVRCMRVGVRDVKGCKGRCKDVRVGTKSLALLKVWFIVASVIQVSLVVSLLLNALVAGNSSYIV